MRTRLVVALLTTLVVVGGAVVWWRGGIGSFVGRERCTASDGDRSVTLSPDQAEQAATIAAVAEREGHPARAVQVALATAMQESKLLNLTVATGTAPGSSSSGPRRAGARTRT